MFKLPRKEFEEFNDTAFIRALRLFSLAAIAVILYAFVYSGFQIVDEFEHLHASWLVSIGKLPYRDFFEHHHPLLWYLSAPIVSVFYDNAIIFYVMRGVGFMVSALTLWYIYKIALFWGNKTSAWLAVAVVLCNIITVYNFSQFRPDNFMNLGFIMGIYYWFRYMQTQKLCLLIYSFLGFTISVLFLQKISLLLIVVEGVIVYLIYKKNMRFRDVLLAAAPALAIVFIFLGILYYKGIFLEYIELNVRFNQLLVYYFERGSFWYRNLFISFYAFGLVTAFYFFCKENLYYKIISVLYIAEFLMRGFYFAPHPNYYTLLTMLLGLIISVYTVKLMPKYKIICIAMIIGLFLQLGNIFNTLVRTSAKHNSYEHYKLADYVHKNSEPSDLLINGYDKNFNIYRQDVSYYWFGLDMLLPIMELEYNIKEKVDVNKLILQHFPKFVYARDYVDSWALRQYGEFRLSQKHRPEILRHFYTLTPFEYLVVLK